MSQITITFDAIEERQEALDAINVREYKAKIDRVLEFIRSNKKSAYVSEEAIRILEEVKDILEE